MADPGDARQACNQPMRGLYGAESICARPHGHRLPHDSVWRASDWQPGDARQQTAEMSADSLQEIREWADYVLNAKFAHPEGSTAHRLAGYVRLLLVRVQELTDERAKWRQRCELRTAAWHALAKDLNDERSRVQEAERALRQAEKVIACDHPEENWHYVERDGKTWNRCELCGLWELWEGDLLCQRDWLGGDVQADG